MTTEPLVILLASVASAFLLGVALGWLMRDAKIPRARPGIPSVCTRDAGHDGPCNGFPSPNPAIARRAENPVQRETENVAIRRMDGTRLPTRKVWDERAGGAIPYEELGPMFLDQFLLRYFAPWMAAANCGGISSIAPWDDFAFDNQWAKDMPLLFEQLTGYKLNEMQLNNAIAEYVRRLSKSQRADTPVQRETEKANG
jgi:hypothetical protein